MIYVFIPSILLDTWNSLYRVWQRVPYFKEAVGIDIRKWPFMVTFDTATRPFRDMTWGIFSKIKM